MISRIALVCINSKLFRSVKKQRFYKFNIGSFVLRMILLLKMFCDCILHSWKSWLLKERERLLCKPLVFTFPKSSCFRSICPLKMNVHNFYHNSFCLPVCLYSFFYLDSVLAKSFHPSKCKCDNFLQELHCSLSQGLCDSTCNLPHAPFRFSSSPPFALEKSHKPKRIRWQMQW